MFTDFFHKKAESVEYFVALQIGASSVGAAVFTTKEGKAHIVGSSSEAYSGSWDELISATDSAITKAAHSIHLSDIKKAVFGFPPTFLEGDKIKKDKLPNLKKLTTELELTPSGFVVIPEAINFFLEEKEGGPQTVVLVGVSKQELIVSLFRGGKLFGQAVVARSEQITKDFEKAFNSFTNVEIFPSKILLYDGVDIDKIKEELLKYPWADNSKFIHFPKIETLSAEFCLLSVASSAASELSKAIVGDEENTKTLSLETKSSDDINAKTAKKVDASDLGFIKEEDELEKEEENFQVIDSPKRKGFRLTLPHISLPTIPKLVFFGRSKLLILGIVILGLLFFAGYTFASYSLPKATITLIVDPKLFEQEKAVSISPDIVTPSQATGEIPGKQLETQVALSKTVPATGKKLVGEEAKGTVTIYNKTTSSRTFDKGTKISAKNLTFTLDNNIEVPPASETLDGLTYGKAGVSATAAKIGAEGNVTSQTEFVIEDFSTSSYLARNDQAFTGGTSREVNAVSAKDQDDLLNQLTQELKTKAQADLLQKLVNGEKLLNESIVGEVVSRKFSHEAGAETKEVTLTLELKYKALIYQENDFTQLMEKIVQENIPEGFEFVPKETSVDVSSTQASEDQNFRFNARFSARLFPKLDIESIKKEVTGLSLQDLDSYIKQLNAVVGYEIDFDSPFSFFTSKTPRLSKNISIEVKPR